MLYFISTFYFPTVNTRCVDCVEKLIGASASGNAGVTRVGESFHRAQLKINGGDSRRYLHRIFSRTGSTRTVLPVFGCNFSLATGRRMGEGRARRVLVYCLTRPSAGIEYSVCINDDTHGLGKKKEQDKIKRVRPVDIGF